jgi:hypothetical protein
LNSGPVPWATPPGFFQDRVSCPGWFQSAVFLISASWVARITDMSHQHPAFYGNPETTIQLNDFRSRVLFCKGRLLCDQSNNISKDLYFVSSFSFFVFCFLD